MVLSDASNDNDAIDEKGGAVLAAVAQQGQCSPLSLRMHGRHPHVARVGVDSENKSKRHINIPQSGLPFAVASGVEAPALALTVRRTGPNELDVCRQMGVKGGTALKVSFVALARALQHGTKVWRRVIGQSDHDDGKNGDPRESSGFCALTRTSGEKAGVDWRRRGQAHPEQALWRRKSCNKGESDEPQKENESRGSATEEETQRGLAEPPRGGNAAPPLQSVSAIINLGIVPSGSRPTKISCGAGTLRPHFGPIWPKFPDFGADGIDVSGLTLISAEWSRGDPPP
ncbi:hypothetical protein GGX14DRAFT_387578 [Mycena pura]|uniref:Uncharacterized protein n=1 Tax=Mycena pura TaxID=153505 RepID=A0AAD7E108_9AGAR|nr:hypothetical protein GGX14DRAFT_387578 [Mycena pura]